MNLPRILTTLSVAVRPSNIAIFAINRRQRYRQSELPRFYETFWWYHVRYADAKDITEADRSTSHHRSLTNHCY